MKNLVFLFLIILTTGCKNEKFEQENELNDYVEKNEVRKTERKINNLIQDSTLIRKGPAYFITISNEKETDSVIALCSCEKNKKNNTIKIQLTTAIPTKKQLDTFTENRKKTGLVLQLLDLGYLDEINGQFKFLTIKLRDSSVQKISLFSKSTEPDYKEDYFDSTDIENYQIKVSKFNYSIASNIYGDFQITLKNDFGLFKNDRTIKGYFECHNGSIISKDGIKKWNIKEWFKKKNSNRGFRTP